MEKTKFPILMYLVHFGMTLALLTVTLGHWRKYLIAYQPQTGKPYSWVTGGWKKQREMKYNSDVDRDPTGDELNAQWAVKRLNELAKSKKQKPFFMGVGFVRPHTPLIVPQKYFDLFPIESIKLPKILKADAEDTFKNTVTSKEDDRSGDRGTKMYDSLLASYNGDRELALKKIHSGLSCIGGIGR
jgi:iduronate 2-sulfatase